MVTNHFVYESANFNPRIKVLLFLDSAQRGLLENVQNHFSRHLRSWEFAKTIEHIKNWNLLILHRQGCSKMYKTTFLGILEAKKLQKPMSK